MSTIVKTRIKNKVDTLTAWNSSSLTLENGEIALVRVPTGASVTNPVTGKTEPVVELLMKVGDGTSSFADLKWLSAKASDVYNWAKSATLGEVSVSDGTSAKTVTKWLEDVSATKKSASDNATAIENLKKGATDTGSIAYAIKQAIDALDNTDAAVDNQFVTIVKQTNGVVSVTRRALAEADIPQLSLSKINTGDTANPTLDKMLSHINTKISTIHDDLDVAKTDATADAQAETVTRNFVTAVTQTNGRIAVTHGQIRNKDLPAIETGTIKDKAVTTGKLDDKAVTKDKIADSTITDDQINYIYANKVKLSASDSTTVSKAIADLRTAVTGGVHFKGVVAAAPTGTSVTINGTTYTKASGTLLAGDIVIWGDEGREYIFDGSAWQELGDVDRVGSLEIAFDNLDYAGGAFGEHKFVTKVTQEDGLIAAEYAQPKASDIIYDNDTTKTVADMVSANAQGVAGIDGKITAALDALDLAAVTGTDNAANGTIYVVKSVSQSNGKVSASADKLPTASTSQYGIVKLSNATNSNSTALAATANSVKLAYEKANTAAENVSDVQKDYVRYDSTSKQLFVGTTGTSEIIFDCGGAE